MIKRTLREQFGSAFHYHRLQFLKPIQRPTIVIFDAGVRWHEFYQRDDIVYTGQDLYDHMLAGPKTHLEGPDVHTVVLVFDKSKFVPLAKAPEQIRRHLNSERLAWDEANPRLLVGEKLALPDMKLINATRNARYHAVSQLAELIQSKYRPPRGKRLIIDGALLDDPEVPLMIETPMRGERTAAQRCPGWRNACGEADHGMFAWTTALAAERPGEHMLIHTRDTDVLLLAIQQSPVRERTFTSVFTQPPAPENGQASEASHMPEAGQEAKSGQQAESSQVDSESLAVANKSVLSGSERFANSLFVNLGRVSFDATGHVAKEAKDRKTAEEKNIVEERDEIVDINALVIGIEAKIGGKPAENLVVASFAAGNDYVDGYYGLTHRTVFETYLRYHAFILRPGGQCVFHDRAPAPVRAAGLGSASDSVQLAHNQPRRVRPLGPGCVHKEISP